MVDTTTHAPLRVLLFAYITAFSLILLLGTSAQVIIQVALHQETFSREAATIVSGQAVRSQRIDRDSILFINGALDHRATVAEMRRDLAGLEHNRLLFTGQYAAHYPAIALIDGDHGRPLAVYTTVYNAALDLIRLDGLPYPTVKARVTAELPDITTIFYTEPEQLANIQATQAIIDADTDAAISHIRLLEIVLYSLQAAVLIFEGLFVLLPITRRLMRGERAPVPPLPAQGAAKESA